MAQGYDYEIAVIGSGPAGYVAAIRAAQLGARTCLIEKGRMGGTCTNIGCIPTKALWYAAHMLLTVERAGDFGIELGEAAYEFAPAARHRDTVVARLRKGVAGLIKANGVDVIAGSASFTDAHTLHVDGDAEARTVTAEKVFIATGSRPVELPVAPFDHETVVSSADAVLADTLPGSVIVVGGGYIGVEFASIYAAFGVPVTIVEILDSLLPGVDPDCTSVVATALKKRGVKILTGVALESIEKADAGVTAKLSDSTELSAAKVLVCVGRRPDCAGLAIEKAGLELGESGEIVANEHMQTAQPHIYAIGDVCGGMLLAHVASREACVAAAHATGELSAAMDYRVVPAVVYSFPEVACVGLTAEQAADVVDNVVVKKFPFRALGKAHIEDAVEGVLKMVADGRTGQVLGVQMCCQGADLLIAEAALALQLECTAEELAQTIHAHPTLPEAIHEAAEGILGMPINWRG